MKRVSRVRVQDQCSRGQKQGMKWNREWTELEEVSRPAGLCGTE
jgi:hypothetical protein